MRHGKTDWNVQYRLQGSVDIPLNDIGREQALKSARKNKDVNFDICFCSPLSRARETAKIFLEGRDVPIIIDERLHEMRFGECEGIKNVYERPDVPVYKLFFDPINYVPAKGGETFDELFARTSEFIQEKVNPLIEQGKDVLIIGHGAMNNSIINKIWGIPLERFWDTKINNCELIKIY